MPIKGTLAARLPVASPTTASQPASRLPLSLFSAVMLSADERRILKQTWDKVSSMQEDIGAETLTR